MPQLKLIPAPDCAEELLSQRLLSEDGKIQMAIHTVMFGYRVRAGYTDNFHYDLDWCGGADQTQVELLYSIAKNIIEHKGSFEGVPGNSDIKPFFNDPAFLEKIYSLVTMPLEMVKLNPLHIDRIKMLTTLFNDTEK